MALQHYIYKTGIQTNELNYTWEEGDLLHIFEKYDDENLANKLNMISYRAHTALTVAIGEWVIGRFLHFPDLANDELEDPQYYIEAGYAAVVNQLYHSLYTADRQQWNGPVLGPIAFVGIAIVDAIRNQEQEGDFTAALHMNNLAEYVLPDTTAYLAWRDDVLDKLVTLYPYDDDETLGEVVPQEIFDPSFKFNIDDTELLINQFLDRLDRDENFILNSPELMKKNQFKGIPYQFDIEQDQKDRLEW